MVAGCGIEDAAAAVGVCAGDGGVLDDAADVTEALPSLRPNNCRRSRRRLLLESTEPTDGDSEASVKADDKIMDPPPGMTLACPSRPPGRKAGEGGFDGFGVDATEDVLDVGVDDVAV